MESAVFGTWAKATEFRLPSQGAALLCRCESPAEAVFVRALLERPDVAINGPVVEWHGSQITLQHPVRGYRVDVAVRRPGFALAIEIDGVTFHSTDQRALSKDHLRQRRLVYAGYTVIRFTARDVFRNAARCWREVAFIHERRAKSEFRSHLRLLATCSP